MKSLSCLRRSFQLGRRRVMRAWNAGPWFWTARWVSSWTTMYSTHSIGTRAKSRLKTRCRLRAMQLPHSRRMYLMVHSTGASPNCSNHLFTSSVRTTRRCARYHSWSCALRLSRVAVGRQHTRRSCNPQAG